ncbi:MAG: hypothetical protein AAB772_02355 [Patescibacteria group bacterium]
MRKKNKFLILTYGWLLFILIVPVIAGAVKLKVQIPGNPNAGASPEAYVKSLYNFGRIAVGVAAFGVIVFAALEYAASAGNASRQQDARDRIKEAILGIILLFGATLVFNLINTDIWDTLDAGLPVLGSLKVAPPPKTSAVSKTNPNLTTDGKLVSGNTCGQNSDCSSGSCVLQPKVPGDTSQQTGICQ